MQQFILSYNCKCGKYLSLDEIDYCRRNKLKFNGNLYCFKCQKNNLEL